MMLSPIDHLQIMRIIPLYCQYLDDGHVDGLTALFAEDGVLAPRFDGGYVIHGRTEIGVWFARYNAIMSSGFRHLSHVTSPPVIEISGDSAISKCHFTANFVSNENGQAQTAHGRYWDRFVRSNGGWFIAEHQIDVYYTKVGGDAIETFATGVFIEPMKS